MAMTRKNYEAIAKLLREEKQNFAGEGQALQALAYVTSGMASIFAADNQAFDRAKFISAAGGGLQ